MKSPWSEKVTPIGAKSQSEPEFFIMQVKVFRMEDYKSTEAFERDINNFIYKKQKEHKPNQITSMPGEVHILYGSDLS
jgi:hypothetical protein